MSETSQMFSTANSTAPSNARQRYALGIAQSSETVAPSHAGQQESVVATSPIAKSRIRSRELTEKEVRRFGTFFAKAAFQGIVTSIDQETGVFKAQLWPLLGYIPRAEAGEVVDADAEFPIEAITDDDLPLVNVGSVFIWMTGYREGVGISREWVSNVRFRRLPARSKAEIEAIGENSKDYLSLFSDS